MYLVIKGRNEAVKNIQLDADRNTWLIGRESSCDIVLNSSQISRRHAKIICENNSVQMNFKIDILLILFITYDIIIIGRNIGR